MTTNQAIFYLGTTNGVIQTKTNNYTHVVQGFEAPMGVAHDSTGGRFFKGALDEIGIWNRTLSGAEIAQILANGINGGSLNGARPSPAPGTFTWTGSSDVYWTNTTNWATNALPGAANTVFFNDSAAGNLSTQITTNFAVAGINISGGIRGVGIAGTNTLTIGAGGVNITNSYASLTLAVPTALSAGQTWTVPNGTLTLSAALTGSGNPSLIKAGSGSLNLNNANSYGGALNIAGGTVSLPAGWTSPSLVGNVGVASNATLVFASHPYSYSANNYTTNAGTVVVNGDSHCANLVLTGGEVSGSGGLRVGTYWGSGGSYTAKASSRSATIAIGWISLYATSPTFTVENGTADPDLLISTPIKDGANGTANFTKSGAGTLTLSQPNTYTGNTTNNQGTLRLTDNDNILPTTTSLNVASGATLTLNNIHQTVAGLWGAGSINLGSGSLTVATANNTTFTGIISGTAGAYGDSDTLFSPPGGLAKDGAGKLTLTRNQTFSGETWLLGGTLALNNAGAISFSTNIVLSSGTTLDVSTRTDGSLNLAAGQTLKGFGTVSGKVAVGAGATLSPGGSAGTLATGAQTWSGGGSYVWEISDPNNPSAHDLVAITGTLNLQASAANPFTIKITSLASAETPGPLTGFDNTSSYQWTLATATGGVLNFNPNAFILDVSAFGNSLGGGTFNLAVSGNALVLNFRPYPPSAPLITGAAALPGTGFSLSGTGIANQVWIFSAASNLIAPVTWTPLATNAADGSGFFQFVDIQATNFPQRFYRVATP